MKKVASPKPSNRMACRWLAAFGGHDQNLVDSLRWELSMPDRERAAEALWLTGGSRIGHCKVGLFFDRMDVVRAFRGDVWSVTEDDGSLRPTRHHSQSYGHSECFLRKGAFPVAIITIGRIDGNLWRQIMAVAKEYGVPVYKYNDGQGGCRIALK